MLVPKVGDASIELAQLGGEDNVMSIGQTVQENGTLLACALDLATNFGKCSHAWKNDKA